MWYVKSLPSQTKWANQPRKTQIPLNRSMHRTVSVLLSVQSERRKHSRMCLPTSLYSVNLFFKPTSPTTPWLFYFFFLARIGLFVEIMVNVTIVQWWMKYKQMQIIYLIRRDIWKRMWTESIGLSHEKTDQHTFQQQLWWVFLFYFTTLEQNCWFCFIFRFCSFSLIQIRFMS